MTRSRYGLCLRLAVLLAVAAQAADAYTDPGSGALLFQMLAAGLVGVLFHARKAMVPLLRLFRRRKGG